MKEDKIREVLGLYSSLLLTEPTGLSTLTEEAPSAMAYLDTILDTRDAMLGTIQRYENYLRGYKPRLELRPPHEECPTDNESAMAHLFTMIEDMYHFHCTGRHEKLLRWIGFIEGAFWQMNVYSRENVVHQKRRAHLATMPKTVIDFLEKGSRVRAMHWLGFMQGALWRMGEYTLDELKDQNRP